MKAIVYAGIAFAVLALAWIDYWVWSINHVGAPWWGWLLVK